MSGVDKFKKYLESSEGIKVSGSGTVAVGNAVVKISGSGRYVENEILKVSGSARVDGDIKVRMVSISGSFKSNGNMYAETVKIAGAANIFGNLKAEVISIAGVLKVGEDIKAETLKAAGAITFRDGKFDLLKVSGVLKAENIEASKFIMDIEGSSKVKNIKADFVEVKRLKKPFVKIGPIEVSIRGGLRVSSPSGVLDVDKIKALKAELESVICGELKARIAIIGENCYIRQLYYSESLQVSDKAKVGQIIKVEDIDGLETNGEDTDE